MKQELREFYDTVNGRYPAVGSVMLHLYRRQPFDTVHKRIKGHHNTIKYDGSVLSSVTFDIIGSDNRIEIHNACILNSVTFHIRGDRHSICIGERCRFNRGGEIWFEDSDGRLEIGNRSTFENPHLAVNEPGSIMRIGEDCMFAYDIDVRTSDSHSIIDPCTGERLNYAKDVIVGNHVWVAAHCIILKGVTIADESVVATGSVVTRKFDQKGVVIAGNPAKIVQEGITWSRERFFRTDSEQAT